MIPENIKEYLQRFTEEDKQVKIFEINLPRRYGLFFRYFPFQDREVDLFLVRDLDSRFTKREVSLVDEWLNQIDKYPIHVIRDNPVHNIPILGGTCGFYKGSLNCGLIFDLLMLFLHSEFNQLPNDVRDCYHGSDQYFLNKYIYPIYSEKVLAHIQKGLHQLRFSKNDIEINPPEDGDYVGAIK